MTDAEDGGKLKIAAREPQVGATVSGTLTDEDGGVRGRECGSGTEAVKNDYLNRFGSYRSATADCMALWLRLLRSTSPHCCMIDKAQSSSYATTSADGGFFVHLVVSYTDAFDSSDDGEDETDTAMLVARPTRAVQGAPATNVAPKFGIQDREIDGDDAAPESVTRNVDEGTKPVGDFEATDDDLVDYSLGGADGGMFSLSAPSGNSVSLSLKAAPDFENPADADGDNAYEVSITAKDPSGATDTLMVTVMVDDIDDKPVISLGPVGPVGPVANVAPAFADDAETDFMV